MFYGSMSSAGGVCSTAEDMIRWLVAHLSWGRDLDGTEVINPRVLEVRHGTPDKFLVFTTNSYTSYSLPCCCSSLSTIKYVLSEIIQVTTIQFSKLLRDHYLERRMLCIKNSPIRGMAVCLFLLICLLIYLSMYLSISCICLPVSCICLSILCISLFIYIYLHIFHLSTYFHLYLYL